MGLHIYREHTGANESFHGKVVTKSRGSQHAFATSAVFWGFLCLATAQSIFVHRLVLAKKCSGPRWAFCQKAMKACR